MLNIGSAIRIVRQAKAMKSGEVAAAAGISSSFLSLVEAGEREPSLQVIHRIADALQVPAEALMVLAQPEGGKLQTSNATARRLVDSVQKLSDAEERLRRWLDKHGGSDEAERSSA